MNFLVLSTGDAIFVPADGIHAYLSGDIVECMARSNNVINTGFCPRADRDSVELFTSALTFSPHSADEAMLPAKSSKRGRHGRTKELAPPMSEFNMLVTQLEAKQQEVVEPVQGPSVMIVTSGTGTMKVEGKTRDLKEGYVFFVGQGVPVELESEKGMVAYRAYAEA
jgi:mannose-6-phosphate isomerase